MDLIGLGGERMAREGVRLMADLESLAVMGFVEVAVRLPYFVRLQRRVRRALETCPPDLLILVDYPGFNLRLAERASSRGIPVLYFIAPQVWAWRPERARRLASACDLVCAVLPFEEELLASYGAPVRFVGHPLLDEEPVRAVDPSPPSGGHVLGLFPGSRLQEVRRLLPVFLAAARRLAGERSDLEIVVARAPNLPVEAYAPVEPWRLLPARTAIDRCHTALCKSGTITLQLALAGVPMVVAYRMHPLSHAIARRLVTIEHISLVNLVLDRRLVPELIQDQVTGPKLVEAVRPLVDGTGEARRTVCSGLAETRRRLGEPGCTRRVADAALDLLGVA